MCFHLSIRGFFQYVIITLYQQILGVIITLWMHFTFPPVTASAVASTKNCHNAHVLWSHDGVARHPSGYGCGIFNNAPVDGHRLLLSHRAFKWNPIKHRLCSEISKHWAGQPLTDYPTVAKLIGQTRTWTGLSVRCWLPNVWHRYQNYRQRDGPDEPSQTRHASRLAIYSLPTQ